jgi:signal transduction histidine kinase
MQDPQYHPLETQPSSRPPNALLLLPPPPAPPTIDRRERLASPGSGVSELAHDARNLISALSLYCDLLASPGVLAPGYQHYAEDLRRLAGGGARLIDALAGVRTRHVSGYPDRGHSRVASPGAAGHGVAVRPLPSRRTSALPFPGIEDLAEELAALEAPLRALAGPSVRLEIECAPCAGRLAMNSEELLRILFNLVANAVEAMASTAAELRRNAFLRITAQRGGGASFAACFSDRRVAGSGQTVVLSVRDNGPGIAARHLQHIFEAGFSTRQSEDGGDAHGLGLAIVAQLVAQAGGAVRAVSPSGLGARFDIELPILPEAAQSKPELARPLLKRKIPNLQQISAQVEKEA